MAAKSAAAQKVAPLADRVVVKALEETETMRGGLYIPDTAKEKPQQGEVIAVVPFLLYVGAYLIVRFLYKIDEKKYAQIVKEVEEKRALFAQEIKPEEIQ